MHYSVQEKKEIVVRVKFLLYWFFSLPHSVLIVGTMSSLLFQPLKPRKLKYKKKPKENYNVYLKTKPHIRDSFIQIFLLYALTMNNFPYQIKGDGLYLGWISSNFQSENFNPLLGISSAISPREVF